MSHALVLGGARSGKTGFAEQLVLQRASRPAYLATAQTLDDEMRERIRAHKASRSVHFATIEEPVELADALRRGAAHHDFILVDCLTLWITNLLGIGINVAAAVEDLVEALQTIDSCQIVLVSNEVGLGIVPDNALARTFRDLAGAAHQRLAGVCDDVYFVVAGLPMTLKGHRPDAPVLRPREA
jgi:adenosylcobinamide kinase / adenosylcobinamide-phosphate guanylyltransferase